MRLNSGAVHILIREGEKLLFVLRKNTGVMDGQYCLPSGRVEDGESYSAAAVREALEEVGAIIDQDEIGLTYVQHRRSQNELGEYEVWTDMFFEAGKWRGESKNAEPDKHEEAVWFYTDDLPENIIPWHRYAIDRIGQGHTYGEWGWENIADNDKKL